MNGELPPVFRQGLRIELGSHRFTEAGIVRFARKFDPQPFHLDAAAARASVFGGLCASGWHTAAVWMRKMRDYQKSEAERAEQTGSAKVVSGPSPGFRDLKWLRPVYVDDTIFYFYETTVCRQSASKPGWHVVTGRNGGVNHNGEPVLEFESTALLKLEAARS